MPRRARAHKKINQEGFPMAATLFRTARWFAALFALSQLMAASPARAETAPPQAPLQVGMKVAPIPGQFTVICDTEDNLLQLSGYATRKEKYAYRLMFDNEYCAETAETDSFEVVTVHGTLVELADTRRSPAVTGWGVAESFHAGAPLAAPTPQTNLCAGQIVTPVVAVHDEFVAGCTTKPMLQQALQFRADRDKENFEMYFQRQYCLPLEKGGTYQILSVSGKAVEFINLRDKRSNVVSGGGLKLDVTPVKNPDGKTRGWWAPAEAFTPQETLFGDDNTCAPAATAPQAASSPQPAAAQVVADAPAAPAAPAPLKAGMVVTPLPGRYLVACDSQAKLTEAQARWAANGKNYVGGTYDQAHCRKVFEGYNYRLLSLAGEFAQISSLDYATKLWAAADAFAQAKLSDAQLAALPGTKAAAH
jgi:hypothetical protein